MGQKVNPIGFRTGVMIGWKSRWYAGKQEFADLLVEDQKIRRFIKKRKDREGKVMYPMIAKIEIERTRDEVKVILHSARPGVLIGARANASRSSRTNCRIRSAGGSTSRSRKSPGQRSLRNSWPKTWPSSWAAGPAFDER